MPDKDKSKKLIKENRTNFSRLVRWITGHNFLKRHNAIINPDNQDLLCRYCSLEPETSSHLVTDCEVLCHVRAEAFNTHFLSTTEPYWQPHNLIKFINDNSVKDLEQDESYIPNSQHSDIDEPINNQYNNSLNRGGMSPLNGTAAGSSTQPGLTS